MRALAEFVMRGRAQAIAVAALAVSSQLFALIGVAVVGLVALRRGTRDGLIVMAWAMLPALAYAVLFADVSGVMALLGVALAALSLRATRSWPTALSIAVAVGVITAILFNTVAGAYVAQWMASATQLMDELNRHSKSAPAPLPTLNATVVSGALGWGACSYVMLSLLLARWWQAQLYNPGGFRSEFHQLRLPLPMALGLFAAGMGLAASGSNFEFWAWILVTPLELAGLALIHGVVGIKRLGRGVLVAVYLALFLIGWLKLILLALALIDSYWNFRARITPRASN